MFLLLSGKVITEIKEKGDKFMSGHSKWANIKNKKAKKEGKKAVVFQKYSREIIVAARLGGPDPAGNFRLRTAIEKAKASGLPNDNIKRAIIDINEQIRIQQAAQREFQEKLQKAQAAEEAYKKAYNQAYDNYVKNMNGSTGRRWTLKKIGIILAVIVVVILIGCIMWLIPPFRRMLINLYEENDIVHMLVNLIVGIVKAFRI